MFGRNQKENHSHPTLEQMIDYLDRRRTARRLHSHLTQCSACQITLERHRRLLALDQALGVPERVLRIPIRPFSL